jgi:hypothetical protein
MNERIFQMAREAHLIPTTGDCDPWYIATVVRFYHMVQAEERRACEAVCDTLADEGKTAYQCRDAIHARGLT